MQSGFVRVYASHYKCYRYINIDLIAFFNRNEGDTDTYIRFKSNDSDLKKSKDGDEMEKTNYLFVRETPEELNELISKAL